MEQVHFIDRDAHLHFYFGPHNVTTTTIIIVLSALWMRTNIIPIRKNNLILFEETPPKLVLAIRAL